jgi:heme A synthase
MFVVGGTVALIILIIAIGYFLVKSGFNGEGGGCGLLIAIAIVILVVLFLAKSCQAYEEDWGEHGRYAPKEYKIKYDEQGTPYINNRYDAPESDYEYIEDKN